jgi:hypothetical protein
LSTHIDIPKCEIIPPPPSSRPQKINKQPHRLIETIERKTLSNGK